jgi:LysM repeat protein
MSKSSFKAGFVTIVVGCLLVSGCARAPRRVPGPSAIPQRAENVMPASFGIYHTVERGQTVFRIAKFYGVDWRELMRINHISNPSGLVVGQRLFIPRVAAGTGGFALGPLGYNEIRKLVGPRRPRSDWKTITVHHSGTHQGNAKLFHRDHTRRHMGGLFYHFVIGNGTNSADGSLEVGFRWQRQMAANRPRDIQICLVGNFDEQFVSDAQFNTLVELIRILQQDYGIGAENIRRHEDIKGKNTACPGRNFPFQRLISELSR